MGLENMPIAIEPGLFEWLAWYPDSVPDWMSAEELVAAGFNIQTDYEPFVTLAELKDKRESVEQFYRRSHFLTTSILQATKSLGKVVLHISWLLNRIFFTLAITLVTSSNRWKHPAYGPCSNFRSMFAAVSWRYCPLRPRNDSVDSENSIL